MKYSATNPPIQCFINQSKWIKEAVKNGRPVGVLWHDTGAGNPYISRYVQPDDNAANRNELLELIGVNRNANDWNHSNREAGVNLFIGKLANDSVSTVQIGPLTTHPWGCGSGSLGSCNGYNYRKGQINWIEPFWIQFEICDDSGKKANSTARDYTKCNKDYFKAIYQEACEVTAYLCKEFGIDPNGTVIFEGAKVPTILCHRASYDYKLGGCHSDVLEWFNVFGYTMDNVRKDVAKILAEDKEQSVEPTEPKEEPGMTAEQEAAFEKLVKRVEQLEKQNKIYHYWSEIKAIGRKEGEECGWAYKPLKAMYDAGYFAGNSPSDLGISQTKLELNVQIAKILKDKGQLKY